MPADEDAEADPTGLRQFVFGDRDIDDWPPSDANADVEPWRSFVHARAAFHAGETAEAERLWRAIARRPGLESRQVLQAWHFLRSVGATPAEDIAGQVLGAVAEVAVDDGHDVLAAYADGSVRYLNFSGAAVVLDAEIASVAAPAAEMLSTAETIVAATGPWEGRLPPLPPGHSRLTVLTPLGPHFGQGPDAALRADPVAATFFEAAKDTLVAVVAVAPAQ